MIINYKEEGKEKDEEIVREPQHNSYRKKIRLSVKIIEGLHFTYTPLHAVKSVLMPLCLFFEETYSAPVDNIKKTVRKEN